jgi:hypothetical protein
MRVLSVRLVVVFGLLALAPLLGACSKCGGFLEPNACHSGAPVR